MSLFTGDTIRIDIATTGRVASNQPAGPPLDPDSQVLNIKVYNLDEEVVLTDTASRDGQGLYHYDWTMPSLAGTYIMEYNGMFAGEPQLKRDKYKVVWK